MAKEIIKKTITKKTAPKKVVTPSKITSPVVIAPEFKLSKYTDKNIKISPRKLRLLVTSIKKISPPVALTKLSLTNTKAARVLASALKTAISVAKNNYDLIPETLKFDTITVNEGPKTKRLDKSHGSHFARGVIIKRHSYLTIIVKGQVKK
ncbi:MAG TPA: uL22 family ribosomal protein [Candidatus Woesebacteria bacterium]|nr:uL22 family ribosomal protein [Candidatus Woesebacteria bacterium]